MSNEKEGPSIHVRQYGTWSLWLYTYKAVELEKPRRKEKKEKK